MKENYSIKFEGELSENTDRNSVMSQLKEDYGLDDATLANWFSGETVTLRASIASEEIPDFKRYFEQLGMILVIDSVIEDLPEIEGSKKSYDSLEAAETIEQSDDHSMTSESERSEEFKNDLSAEKIDNNEPPLEQTLHDDVDKAQQKLEMSLEELKNALKENKKAFLFRPANLGIRLTAFIIDAFIFAFSFGLIVQYLLVPLGIVDPLFNELSQYILQGVGTGVVDIVQLQNSIAGDGMMNYLGEVMSLPSEVVERLKGVDVIKERNTIAMAGILFFCFYFTFVESSRLQTSFGKRLFNLRVYSLNSPYTRLSQAFLRVMLFTIVINISQILNGMIPGLGTLLLVSALGVAFFDKRGLRQTIFDRLSNTCVGYDKQVIKRGEE